MAFLPSTKPAGHGNGKVVEELEGEAREKSQGRYLVQCQDSSGVNLPIFFGALELVSEVFSIEGLPWNLQNEKLYEIQSVGS